MVSSQINNNDNEIETEAILDGAEEVKMEEYDENQE